MTQCFIVAGESDMRVDMKLVFHFVDLWGPQSH